MQGTTTETEVFASMRIGKHILPPTCTCDSHEAINQTTAEPMEPPTDDGCSSQIIRWEYVRKFWKVGRFEDPEFGVSLGIGWRLDKNDKRDCFEITLTRDDKTVAYVLIELLDDTFALRGMNVYEEFRGKGLAGVLTALWLKLCAELNCPPSTKKIDKPVISLMLQKFGFKPHNETTSVHVSTKPGVHGEVVCWSANLQQLRSQFSKRYLKTQNMVVLDEKPENTRQVWVNTLYVPPSMEVLADHVENVLQRKTLFFYTTRNGNDFGQFVSEQLAHLPAFHARRQTALLEKSRYCNDMPENAAQSELGGKLMHGEVI